MNIIDKLSNEREWHQTTFSTAKENTTSKSDITIGIRKYDTMRIRIGDRKQGWQAEQDLFLDENGNVFAKNEQFISSWRYKTHRAYAPDGQIIEQISENILGLRHGKSATLDQENDREIVSYALHGIPLPKKLGAFLEAKKFFHASEEVKKKDMLLPRDMVRHKRDLIMPQQMPKVTQQEKLQEKPQVMPSYV